jgi:hypothetical protein
MNNAYSQLVCCTIGGATKQSNVVPHLDFGDENFDRTLEGSVADVAVRFLG